MVRKQEVTISCLLLSKSIMEVLLRQLARPFTKENEISCITEPHKITKKVLLQVIDFL